MMAGNDEIEWAFKSAAIRDSSRDRRFLGCQE
jgi:hypothetical protein